MDEGADIDAVVITALPEELDALLAVESGRVGEWSVVDGDPRLHLASFETDGGELRLAAASATKMGGATTAQLGERLIGTLRPRSLAMCGVCAGHPGDTTLGDVVIAERVFHHDEGKRGADGLRGDVDSYRMTPTWLETAKALVGPARGLPGYAEPGAEDGQWWLLEQLVARRDPLNSAAFRRFIPDERRAATLEQLERERKYIKITNKGKLSLTKQGRATIMRHLVVHGVAATQLPYHIHVGPMGSGNFVAADAVLWQWLADSGGERKTLAIEMEAAAVGQVAHGHSLPFVVAKGVMDHADAHKRDTCKGFAARASAEVLCRFLREVHGRSARAEDRTKQLLLRPGSGRGRSRRRAETSDEPEQAPPYEQEEARDDDGRRGRVLRVLEELLERDVRVLERLAQAHAPWRQASGKGNAALARALVSVDTKLLSTAWLAALRLAPELSKAEAETLRLLFEYALPYVATASSPSVWREDGRFRTSVRKPQTLEAHVAWIMTSDDLPPRLQWYSPKADRDHPVPRYYVDVNHIPEGGAVVREDVETVKRDIDIRHRSIRWIGEQWFGRQQGGGEDFLDTPEGQERATNLSQDVQASGSGRPLYSLVREPNEIKRGFIDDLHEDTTTEDGFKALQVFEAWPTESNLDEDFHLLAHIRAIYNCLRDAGVEI